MNTERLIYMGLGGNVGDVRATFNKALLLLPPFAMWVARKSSLYASAPVGGVAQPDFLNAVVEIACILPPEAVLHHLQNVEHILGRNRALEQRWGPRTLDVDYLMDTAYPTFTKPDLELPHPRMWERAFVLCPLAELLPSTFTPQGEPLPLAANRLAKEQHIRKLTKAEGPDLW